MHGSRFGWLILAVMLMGGLALAQAATVDGARVRLTLDTSEARQALAILHEEQSGKPVTDADWQQLFATAP